MRRRRISMVVLAVGGFWLPLSASVPGAVTQQPITSGFGQGAYRAGSGIRDPVVVKEVAPQYTAEARRAVIEGPVELEVVVETNGKIEHVRITKSLDAGLDAEAIKAVKQWWVIPGRLGTVPVPVLLPVVLEFRINPGEPPLSGPLIVRLAPHLGRPDDFHKDAYTVRRGLTTPKLVKQVAPEYTAAASQRKIQGIAEVEAVVLPDGRVDRARIRHSLDAVHGLDEAAIAAAKQFVFEPDSGQLNGQPVPVVVLIVVEFRLR